MLPRGTFVLALLSAAHIAAAQPCTGPAITRRGPDSETQIWPRGLRSPNALYDNVDRRLLVVGTSAAGDATQIWEFNGFAWRLIAPTEGFTPPPLTAAAAVYHEATGRILLFGGTLPGGTDSNRTYLFNGLYWDEPFFQDIPPLPLHDAALIYIPALDRALLFGGIRNNEPVHETWTWGMGGWVQRTDPNHPPGGSVRNTLASWPLRQAAIFTDPRPESQGGTWQFDAAGWSQCSTLQPPGSTTQAPTFADPQTGEFLRLTSADSDGRTQRWSLNADNVWNFDRQLDPGLPPQLSDLTIATDIFNKKVMILGRTRPDGDLELWEHDLTPGSIEVSVPSISYGFNSNIFVLASGIAPLSYQWLRDGEPVQDDALFEGTQSPALAIAAASLRCSTFLLSCRVCGPCGCATSTPAPFAFNFIGDFNVDGGTDGQDIEAFLIAWEASDAAADLNCDGGIDGQDIEAFFTCWEAGCR